MTRAGFTMIELLVCLGLLGLITTLLLQFQGGVINATSTANNDADRVQRLEEATGYVSDRVRSAGALPATLNVTSGTVTFTCAVTAASPCFAVLAPETTLGDSTGALSRWVMLAFRFEPRTNLPATQRTVNPWADANTLVLRQYQAVVCTSCARPPAPASITATSVATVAGNLTLAETDTTTFTPFTYDDLTRKVTLRLRTATLDKNKVRYTPRAAPLDVIVFPRNF